MYERIICIIAITPLLAIGGCGDDDGTTDTGVTDTGTTDTGTTDSAPTDTGGGDTGDGAVPYVPDWSCLGSVTVEAPEAATAEIVVTVNDYTSEGPAEGVLIQYCPFDDVDCATPDATGTTDAMGMVTLTLATDPDPWWGYATATSGTALPHEYFISTPVENDGIAGAVILSEAAVNIIALAIGEDQDLDANGAVGLAALDCTGRLSSGVRVELVSGTGTPFYAAGGSFSTAATETDESGAWGLVNAEPGDFTVAAYLAADDTLIGTMAFRAKAGTVVGLYMFPTPDGALYTP